MPRPKWSSSAPRNSPLAKTVKAFGPPAAARIASFGVVRVRSVEYMDAPRGSIARTTSTTTDAARG
jgi:hypothetical protein